MESSEATLRPADGFIDPEVAAEFPGLRLQWATVRARRGPSPPALVRSLRRSADRYRGASVIAMRTKPVPHAYRSFFRTIGLDPDVQRIPSEQAALARLVHGEFRSLDLIADAALLALIETGVPVTALDADRLEPGGPGIRLAGHGDPVEPGTLVVAGRATTHAPLFGEPLAGQAPGPRTDRVALYAIGVDGVPAIHLEEALWIALDLLA